MTGIILSIIVAYLLGSIPTAVWVGKYYYGVDVRNEGSGNAGATNVIRVLGLKAGIPVLLVDVLKGYFAVIVVQHIVHATGGADASPVIEIFAAAAAVIGHTLPLFASFRGGKGVATLLGVGFGLFPYAAWVALGIFAVVLIITHYVSLGSITAGVTFPFFVAFVFPPPHWTYMILAVVVALFLPWTHRKNIQRLINGTESKINFKKSKTPKI